MSSNSCLSSVCKVCTLVIKKKHRVYFTNINISHKLCNIACSSDAGASGRREEGAGESERDVPTGPGEAERVHQSCGERKRTAGAPEED